MNYRSKRTKEAPDPPFLAISEKIYKNGDFGFVLCSADLPVRSGTAADLAEDYGSCYERFGGAYGTAGAKAGGAVSYITICGTRALDN